MVINAYLKCYDASEQTVTMQGTCCTMLNYENSTTFKRGTLSKKVHLNFQLHF
jgi:hypothetical protein